MKIYELINGRYDIVDDLLPQIEFSEERCCCKSVDDHSLRLEYKLDNMPFDIGLSYFLILLQDIHNNLPCGMLFVDVPVGEGYDTIIYMVRFEENEFEKIKNFS